MGDGFVHPYVPNAAPAAKWKLLEAIGAGDVADLYAAIPQALQVNGLLDLPPALPGEHDLRRHLEEIVARNQPCTGTWLNFCGAGCAQHYVPAIVDEIVHRGELLTAYGGGTYSDHGKNQALFEFQSLMGELVGMEVVSTPTYDSGAATGSAATMACRITGRRGVLVPETMSADKRSQLQGFTKPFATIETVASDPATGCTDLADLRAKVSGDIAAVVIESPGYLGPIETQAQAIADIAHEAGALLIAGVDPISLGVLAAPADYGADLVVGDLQPLGIHMYAGGGNGGFIASRDEARFVAEYPSILFSIAPAGGGNRQGFGFGWSTMERTSYDTRHDATDYTGTTQWIWGIGAAVYLSLMGPDGMAELGRGIMQRACFAAERIAALPGVSVPRLEQPFFKEFVVDFSGTGKTVAAVNGALLEAEIHGGKDLSGEFPALGQSALYCVTEMHGAADIERLISALGEAIR